MRIGVIGTGYVGLTTGTVLAYVGHDVTCLDVDEVRIRECQAGRAPIYEPGLDDLLSAGLALGRLHFTTHSPDALAEADVAIIAVGTPSLPNGAVDLSYVETAAASLPAARRDGSLPIIVNKSTVPIGAGAWTQSVVRRAAAEQGVGLVRDPSVVSVPEFLREGCAVSDSLYPDRIVLGADDADARQVVEEMFRPIINQDFAPPAQTARPTGYVAPRVLTTDVVSAEMIKYCSNAFLAMKISFINSAANLCDRIGADIGDVALGMGLDSRIGPHFLQAGVGWGGSCFGKDIRALSSLAEEYAQRVPLLEATLEVNEAQRLIPITKLLDELKVLKGRTIGLLGVAFKPETDDLRDAPSLTIAAELLRRGAHVRVLDPAAGDAFGRAVPEVEIVDSVDTLAKEADALVLVTDWPQFRSIRWDNVAKLMRTVPPVLIDGRNFLDASAVVEAGFRYQGIGRARGGIA